MHAHAHTPSNETFGLGNEETTDTIMEMDMHTHMPPYLMHDGM
jgi:hypothetical protein